ncbi:MAG TPA: hypothetical protein VKA08_11435 [Balneolales bacterium]|nr:hypothetical protein [Balneolales bacterium]
MNKQNRDLHLKRFKYRVIRLLPVLFLCGLWLAGCGGLAPGSTDPGDKAMPYQTRIIEVKKQPDTVAVGDTARITCIIRDSTDKRFQFYWDFSRGEVLHAKYDPAYQGYTSDTSNYVFWIAPNLSGLYGFDVKVDNGSDSTPVTQGFDIRVKK